MLLKKITARKNKEKQKKKKRKKKHTHTYKQRRKSTEIPLQHCNQCKKTFCTLPKCHVVNNVNIQNVSAYTG